MKSVNVSINQSRRILIQLDAHLVDYGLKPKGEILNQIIMKACPNYMKNVEKEGKRREK